nr:hypothetical protein [Tanacetum cinerariifolium]
NSSTTIPRRSNMRRIQHIVEPEFRAIENIVPMADRTMEELLQAPTKGYGEAIVIPKILAKNFEIKTNLLQLVQANKFHGHENDNSHTHIINFKRMTATLKYRDVLNDAIKLMLFPYSLEDRANIWACPHHGFSELTQIDTFYNGLTEQDQDSLNAASGGNLLNKTTREALKIIENKSKVRYSRNKSNVARVNTNSRDVVCKTDDRIDKLVDQISNLVEIVNKQVVAPAKAVKKVCVTCGGAHAYYECIATDSNPSSVYAATGSYNQVSPPNRVSHQIPAHSFASVQNNTSRFNQNQGQGNYFNQANNFNQGNNFRGNNFQNNQGSTAQVQPPVVPISISEPDVSRTQPKPSIPYPSRLNDQKLREKATNQMEKFFQIFHDLHFDISFSDALLLMPKFASTIKSLLANKDKLFELAKVPLNENCSAMLLKKLPESLEIRVSFSFLVIFQGWSRSKSTFNLREVFLENRSCFNRCIWRVNYPQASGNQAPRDKLRTKGLNEEECMGKLQEKDGACQKAFELLQAPTEGYGEAIVIPEILAENFEIKTMLLQLVQANKFHGRENDNPHTHIKDRARIWYEKEPPNSILTWEDLINKFVNQFFPPSKTTHLKNEISRFTQRFDETFSEAWDRFKELLRACPHHGFSELTQIDTFYNGLIEQDQDSLNAASGRNILNKTTREALKIIENKSEVCYSRNVVCKTDDRIDKLADQISNLVKILNKQVVALAKAVEKVCVTCGGAHAYYECIATDSNPSSVYAATGSYNQVSPPNRVSHQIPPPGFASVQNNPSRFNQNQVPNNQIPPSELSSYIISNEIVIKTMQSQINVLRSDFSKQEENLRKNLNDDMRNILSSFFQNQASTSGTLPSNTIPNPKDEMKAVTTRSGLAYEGPSIPTESLLEKVDEQNTEEILDQKHSNSSGSPAQVQPPVVPISILKPDVSRTHSKPLIPYPSSFADALLLMPKFASTIKSLLANKDILFDLAKVPLNENCSAMLLKKLLEKLGDPGKFLIPCDFLGMEVCHAIADLGAKINLMPLSIWKKLLLPELTPTRMTFKLEDRSITRPKGVAEEVFIKVGKFHFPTDFVMVDFEADPRVPLILGRSFLRTGHALIDVYGEEITLRVNNESITFILNQTMRYSSTYDDTSYNPKSSNPTLVSDDLISESDSCKVPIVKSYLPTLSLFGESDFSLDEIEDFLNDDSILTGNVNPVYDLDEDILFLEKLLNEEPFISAKNLKVDEREALLNILKSHKRAIAWKISNIKGIDPRFCTHKILMKDNYKPAVQSQRRVNPKIHDVIKKEVIKLLDAGTFQRCMMSIFHDMIEKTMEVFRDDFSVFGDNFSSCLTNLDKMLNRCEETNLVLNWEKCHFMCREGIFLGHKISKSGIEVDRAKVDVMAKLPHPTTVKGVRSFLGHLTEASILVVPDWNLPFELMRDASDYAIGVVLGQRKSKHFQPIHYARKTMIEAQIHYTTIEKEMLAIVYAFEKFRPYLVFSKSIIYIDHSALKYLLNKQDAKPRLL